MAEERERKEDQRSFAVEIVWTGYGSVVIVAMIAVLNSNISRGIEDDLDAPARTLVAAPVLVAALVVFGAALLALVRPDYRRSALRVAEIAGWLIPAWLLMSGLVLGAIKFALDHVS